jgi:hypothetical protein
MTGAANPLRSLPTANTSTCTLADQWAGSTMIRSTRIAVAILGGSRTDGSTTEEEGRLSSPKTRQAALHGLRAQHGRPEVHAEPSPHGERRKHGRPARLDLYRGRTSRAKGSSISEFANTIGSGPPRGGEGSGDPAAAGGGSMREVLVEH